MRIQLNPQIMKTLSSHSLCRVSPLLCVAAFSIAAVLLLSPRVGNAQPQTALTPSQAWEKIRAADEQLTAVHAVWRREMVFPPQPQLDVEKQVQRAVAAAQQKGENQDDVKQIAEVVRQFAREDKIGHSHTSTLDFYRIGRVIKCEVYTPSPQDPKSSHAVDYFDGKTSVYIPLRVDGEKTNRAGVASREPQEILSRSAFNWLLPKFLVGVPFADSTSSFNPAFTQKDVILDGDKRQIVLERKAALDPQSPKNADPDIHHVTFSTSDYRPRQYDLLTVKRDKIGAVQIGSYQEVRDGAMFPSKVVVTTPAFTATYTLVKSNFNQEVDPSSVLLPPEIRLSDARFGADKSVTYRVTDGVVPSDAKIRKMLGEKAQKETALTNAEKEVNTEKAGFQESSPNARTPVPPLTAIPGLGFIALGGLMLLRTRRKDS